MEADFNFNNKVMGKDAAASAERNLLFPKEQYARKGHRSNHHGVNKRLLYDLAHLQRRPMILCSNDAKSCYDRIVHSIASMAMQRMGMSDKPITCMIVTLQNMKHYIRTAFGDSDSFISVLDEETVPFQGILQGNGAGPTLWLVVSTPLLEMMRSLGHGVTFKTPLSQETESFVGFAYVDDSDNVEGDLRSGTLNIDDVFDRMQQCIDDWEGGLKVTGGAIRPDKSFVYPISFVWDNCGNYKFEKVR